MAPRRRRFSSWRVALLFHVPESVVEVAVGVQGDERVDDASDVGAEGGGIPQGFLKAISGLFQDGLVAEAACAGQDSSA